MNQPAHLPIREPRLIGLDREGDHLFTVDGAGMVRRVATCPTLGDARWVLAALHAFYGLPVEEHD